MYRRYPHVLATALLIALAALGGPAVAQESAAPAESLFDDGRRLLAEGKLAEACAKLTESERLDPAVGTLLNLGDCHEKMGKIATAWAVFKQAADMARRGKQASREKIATGRFAALEPRIPKLSIAVRDPVPGLEVRRDGVLLGATEWSAASPSALPIDPGDHDVAVSAPGKKAWSKKVTLAADGQTTALEVPPLEVDELGERAPLQPGRDVGASVEAVTTHDRDVQRAIAIITGSAGVVSMIVAVPFGFRAIGLNKEAKPLCPTDTTCTPTGGSDAQGAVTSGTVSTVLLMVGGAVLVASVVLFLTAPQPKHEPRATFHVVPSVSPGGFGLVGSF
jgi:hypothetical protein